ncbi:MAG: hypothetical protein QM774_05685 [Gordonia sp. (in: high G+C Gram-positive bacteria)]|uniref:hypothetical protein n=1 Tax=Gordonia sp. (in: high G+C Gram-positive bacteria) TaxID=84139 RepID=UPI0039E6B0F8
MSDDLERVQRWVASGGHVRMSAARDDATVITLITCDGGEEMDRFVTRDPSIVSWCEQHDA